MYAVIFEVQPKAGRQQDYLDLAAALRPELETIDGFISVERFASLTTEGKLLSVSFWRDAAAVKRWREDDRHRRAQLKGRGEIFADYRLSVVEVVRQYGMFDRVQAPEPR
jgi:heme-degrading monooxygenase HmoA